MGTEDEGNNMGTQNTVGLNSEEAGVEDDEVYEEDEVFGDENNATDAAALFGGEGEVVDGPDSKTSDRQSKLFDIPEFTRRDKTLEEILEMMDDNPPIIPDAVIDYYLVKNGFECTDTRIKRLLALATQKFVSDVASDAYEYSRIRSAVAVSNANNGQARARQLMQGPGQQQISQQQQQQMEKSSNSKVVLTVNDLSSAVAEYGLNIARPDFYR